MGAIAVIVSCPDVPDQRVVATGDTVTIGRVAGNDVVLAREGVSRRHARLVVRDDKLIVVDLKSTNGTLVNGHPLTSPRVIKASDRIAIGDFTLAIEEVEEPTTEWIPEPDDASVEAALIAAIAQRDEASRLVYADWLEQRGDHARAELLRLQEALIAMTPEDAQFRDASSRLEELAAGIDMGWRIKVGRPAIEQCMAYDFECPKDWGSLAPTQRRDVRFCGACERNVYYCRTIEQARAHAHRGDCVCVDLVNRRRPGDRARAADAADAGQDGHPVTASPAR